MGRCYEFGAEIHAGCEQAMVVTDEGGACVCRSCGTRCPGRFSGCAGVIAVPGRVPPSAPARALAVVPPAVAGRTAPAGARSAAAPGGSVVPAGRSGDSAPLGPANRLASGGGNGHAGAADPAGGHESLAELVTRAAADQGRSVIEVIEALASEIDRRDAQLTGVVTDLVRRHDDLAERMERFRVQMDKIGVAIDRLASVLVRVEQRLDNAPSLRKILGR
ncbi:MAG TPA: hypothetical protein VFO65_06935 [Acidimicrobiales bacterium]|nr:hypothetical protein [Acidimicrobiales bacterium]